MGWANGMKKPAAAKRLSWSLLSAAEEFGVSRETIRRGLSANGVPQKETYTTKDIFSALSGDLKAARAREALASAIAKERENKIAEGEMIPLSDNLAWQEKVLQPIRNRLNDLPGSMASRCNPTDPDHARVQLSGWLKDSLPILRAEIAKATQE